MNYTNIILHIYSLLNRYAFLFILKYRNLSNFKDHVCGIRIPKGGDWDIVQCARSFDNVVYVASCNHVGTDRDLTFFGKSKIVGPIGRTIAEAEDKEAIVKAEVDLGVLPELRNGYYVLLKDRNPDTYNEITQ